MIALLRYNSHLVQPTILKYESFFFFCIFAELCNHHHDNVQNTLFPPKRCCAQHSPSHRPAGPAPPPHRARPAPVANPNPPQPQAATSWLSVPIDLPILNISYELIHIIHVLCDWLLSICITFSRFIHVVIYINSPFLFITFYVTFKKLLLNSRSRRCTPVSIKYFIVLDLKFSL